MIVLSDVVIAFHLTASDKEGVCDNEGVRDKEGVGDSVV
jgi:hypothetical protein